MRIGRWNLDRSGLRSIYNRRIRPIINPSYRSIPPKTEKFIVNVCNICNLKCFSCSNLMDRPMGSNIYRDIERRTSPEQLDKFLTLIDSWRNYVGVRLTGGEPTSVGRDIIHEMCDITKSHGREVDIVTNGFRLMEIDPFKFDFITLDNHGVNQELIDKCQKFLEEKGYNNFHTIPFSYHRDLEIQRKSNISNGLKCKDWMGSILLWESTVYPCCVMHGLEGMDNNPEVGYSLREAGWTIDNLKLLDTLKNWHNTIPAEVVKTCVLSCWHGGTNIVWEKIK